MEVKTSLQTVLLGKLSVKVAYADHSRAKKTSMQNRVDASLPIVLVIGLQSIIMTLDYIRTLRELKLNQ